MLKSERSVCVNSILSIFRQVLFYLDGELTVGGAPRHPVSAACTGPP